MSRGRGPDTSGELGVHESGTVEFMMGAMSEVGCDAQAGGIAGPGRQSLLKIGASGRSPDGPTGRPAAVELGAMIRPARTVGLVASAPGYDGRPRCKGCAQEIGI